MLKANNIKMYSTHNEGKFVIAERFIRTLETNIYITWLQYQKMYILIKLDDIVKEYNNK